LKLKVGTPIPRTPFLLLKAPVSTLYEEKFGGDRNMFTVGMYCGRMMARSIRVGLVIDATALDIEEFEPLPSTTNKANKFDKRIRYFHNSSEWDEYDVEYHRLSPPKDADSNEPLAPQILPEFYKTVTNFLQKSRSSDTFNNTMTHIAIFDSRGGLGVAAYLAAAYMCHSLKAPVHAAIEAIKEGTPSQSGDDAGIKFGLCDVRLIKDLQTRFKGRKEIVFDGGTPSWWFAMEEEDDEEEEDTKDNDSNMKRKREESIVIPPCESDEDAISTTKRTKTDDNETSLHPNLLQEVLQPVPKDSGKYNRAISVLTQMATSPTSSSSDQKSMSMLPLKSEVDISDGNTNSKDLLPSIKGNPDKYKVTWLSTKGRRGLLLILTEAVFFIDQSTTSISISIVTNMKFPSPKDLSKPQHRTLLEVVLVEDIEKNKSTYRFYVQDILCIEGGMVYHKPLDQRLRYLNDGVLMPRKKDETIQQHSEQTNVYADEHIKIRAKEYFPMKKLAFVMKDVCSGVGHDAEGIRVVPVGEYGIGKSDDNKTKALVWRKGCDVDDEKLKSLLLATE